MNMSLAKLKTIETKGKQKTLPKLKAILANPSTTKCPILAETELDSLKHLLQTTIQESKHEPRVFATKNGICLGLESSLRKINNRSSCCVFISLSIKPNYIVSLIARNASAKNETQPVYAQPKLENLTEDIFGVKALCMVFPKEFVERSEDLKKWVDERKKPTKIKTTVEPIKKSSKRKIKTPIIKKSYIIKESNSKTETLPKSWSGDFISFSNDNHVMKSSKLDGDEAINALSKIIDEIPTSSSALTKIPQSIEPMVVDSVQNANKKEVTQDSDSDDFLEEYKTLIVHKIKGNPNKKPKKKRQKKKKKNIKK